jgi:hypothetical protein
MRGHLQALCAVYGFDAPIVVTFKGKASQEMERLLRDWTQRLAEAVARAGSGRKFPSFAFYMKLAAGPHTKAGQKGQESVITPPVLDVPHDIGAEYLNKIYVGRERLIALQQLYHEAASWAAAWDRAGVDAEGDDAEPEQDRGPF